MENGALKLRVNSLEKELHEAKRTLEMEKAALQKSLDGANSVNKLIRNELEEIKAHNEEMKAHAEETVEKLNQNIHEEKLSHDKTREELKKAYEKNNAIATALREEKSHREAAEEKVEKWEQAAILEKVDHERTRGEVKNANESIFKDLRARFENMSEKLEGSAFKLEEAEGLENSAQKTPSSNPFKRELDSMRGQLTTLTKKFDEVMEKVGTEVVELKKGKKKSGGSEKKEDKETTEAEQKDQKEHKKKKGGFGNWLKRKFSCNPERKARRPEPAEVEINEMEIKEVSKKEH